MLIMYIRYPLPLWLAEALLIERCIEICHQAVLLRWNRFGPMFAEEIRKRRVQGHLYSNWRWHLDEVFMKIAGEKQYVRRAVDH